MELYGYIVLTTIVCIVLLGIGTLLGENDVE